MSAISLYNETITSTYYSIRKDKPTLDFSSLRFQFLSELSEIIHEITNVGKDVLVISLVNAQISDKLLEEIIQHCPKVQKINFQNSKLNNEQLKKISACKELKKLNINLCKDLTCKGFKNINFDTLLSLKMKDCKKIKPFELTLLIKGAKNLVSLDISGDRVTDLKLKEIITSCPLLEKLSFERCKKLTNMVFLDLAQNCKSLTHVSYKCCSKLTDEGFEKYFPGGLPKNSIMPQPLPPLSLQHPDAMIPQKPAIISNQTFSAAPQYWKENVENLQQLPSINAFSNSAANISISSPENQRYFNREKFASFLQSGNADPRILFSNAPTLAPLYHLAPPSQAIQALSSQSIASFPNPHQASTASFIPSYVSTIPFEAHLRTQSTNSINPQHIQPQSTTATSQVYFNINNNVNAASNSEKPPLKKRKTFEEKEANIS